MTLTSDKSNQVKLMSRLQNIAFPSGDIDPMTLILKVDLHMVKVVPPYQELSFYVNCLKSYNRNRQTDTLFKIGHCIYELTSGMTGYFIVKAV